MTIKQKTKKVDHNKSLPAKTKVIDFYNDLLFMKQMPVSEAFIDRLSAEMVAFADLEDTLRPSQFWNSKRLSIGTIDKWRAKWPQLERAYEYLVARIADRRDIGAITRKYDGSYVERSLAMYDPEYKKFLEWKASIADKNKESSGTLVVQMYTAPNSDLVPVKKKDGPIDV